MILLSLILAYNEASTMFAVEKVDFVPLVSRLTSIKETSQNDGFRCVRELFSFTKKGKHIVAEILFKLIGSDVVYTDPAEWVWTDDADTTDLDIFRLEKRLFLGGIKEDVYNNIYLEDTLVGAKTPRDKGTRFRLIRVL